MIDMSRRHEEIRIRKRPLLTVCIALSIWMLNAAHATEPAAPISPKMSLDELSATRDRPLFSPSRRPRQNNVAVAIAPPPPPPPPPQAPAPAPNLTFFGTFEGPTEVGAAVQIPPNDKPIIVRYGTYIDGWRVVDISHHRLVLALEDRKVVFTLFNPPAGTTPPDVALPAAQQFHPPPAITPAPAPVQAPRSGRR
jgi:general secretion pathway protein N